MWVIEKYDSDKDAWVNVTSFAYGEYAQQRWNDYYGDLSSHRLIHIIEETYA